MLSVEIGSKGWHNWSGSVSCRPRQVVYPESLDDVVTLVNRCNHEGRSLRVVGSGHSFTRLVETDDLLVSLDRLAGIVDVDHAAHTATVLAGTKLRELGELLHARGLAQENLGDIDKQSIGGAISTGTHGTGGRFGTLSTQVVGLTAVLGDGSVIECSQTQHPDWFRAVQVSFGSLGILVQVKLRLVPSFRMMYESRRLPLSEVLARLGELRDDHRHFEFYAFPYGDAAQVKTMQVTDQPATPSGVKGFFNKIVMENWAFGALSEACRAIPRLCPAASRFSANNVPVFREVGYSHRLFATPRLVRFNEMEYNVPAAHMPAVVEEIRAAIASQRVAVHFPIECRFVQADDIWLSPAFGRDSAYIAVHMYRGMPYADYFRTVEAICAQYGGRPHWGKLNWRTGDDFRRLYPMWDRFCDLRAQSDPRGIFLNDYLRGLFETAGAGELRDAE